MIASAGAALTASVVTQRLIENGYWGAAIILLVAVASVILILATDDRDPSTVLAWFFIVLLFPGLGLIAYFFIGRNYRRDSPRRRRIMAQMEAVADESLAPVAAANTEFTQAAVDDLEGTPGGRLQAIGHKEGRMYRFRPTPWTSTRPARRSSPPCSRRWRPPSATSTSCTSSGSRTS